MTNPFTIGNYTVKIETGFIPSGREYTRLKEILSTYSGKSGSFQMQFTTFAPTHSFTVASVLTVSYCRNK